MSDQLVTPPAASPATPPSLQIPADLIRDRYQIGHVTICSVYPGDLYYRLPHSASGAGFTPYSIPAVPIDKPDAYELLHVWDSHTTVLNTAETLASSADYDAMTVGDSGKKFMVAPVPARVIAYDLIRHWSGDAPGAKVGLTIGVGTIAGDSPTAEELHSLRSLQTAYFRFLVEQADSYHAQNLWREITDYHRRALRWLGSEDREWFKRISRTTMKPCPACAEPAGIPADAIICKYCRTNLAEHYANLGYKLHEVKEVDEVVAAALGRMIAAEERAQKANRTKE